MRLAPDANTSLVADRQEIAVLHVRIVRGAGGGPEKTILSSARSLADTRYREIACYLHAPDDPGSAAIERRARNRGCPLICIPDAGLSIATMQRLVSTCRSLNVRIWHGHDYKSNLLGIVLRPILGFKLVTTVHGWVEQTRRTSLYYAVDRWCLPRYDQVIAVSDDLYRRCGAVGVPADRLHLIENGVDPAEYDAAGRSVGSPASPFGERLVVLGIGRLAEEKGFDLLIAAVARLIEEGFDLGLSIVGEGEERGRLLGQIQAGGHGDRIRLLGYCEDVRPLLAGCHVFCLSSRSEGLPNVLLEAMAMAAPIVATRCGGVPDFGRDGEDMLLAAPDSVEDLAAALRRLILNPALRARLAARARRRVEAECSFEDRMRKVLAVYERLWG